MIELRHLNRVRLIAEGIQASSLNTPSVRMHEKVILEAPFYSTASMNWAAPLSIGAFTHINGGNFSFASVGRYCSIANEVAVGQAEHPLDRLSFSPLTWDESYLGWRSYLARHGHQTPMKVAPTAKSLRPYTKIGNDVWIGYGAFLRSGVTIGDGAIIGARSVVLKDVEPFQIVAGSPARPIRARFPDKMVEKLLKLKWWNYCLFDEPKLGFKDMDSDIEALEASIAAGGLKPYQGKIWTPARLQELCGN